MAKHTAIVPPFYRYDGSAEAEHVKQRLELSHISWNDGATCCHCLVSPAGLAALKLVLAMRRLQR
eukprot:6854022-Karenia_brevis.AAC.1